MLRSMKNLVAVIVLLGMVCTIVPFVDAAGSRAGAKPMVAVLVDYPQEYLQDEESLRLLNKKAQELFPVAEYRILPLDAAQNEMKSFRIKNGIPHQNYYSAKPLTETQVLEISRKMRADHALYLRLEGGEYADNVGFLQYGVRLHLSCVAALMDVQNGKYTGTTQIIKTSRSTANNDTVAALYFRALEKVLADLDTKDFIAE